MRNIKSTRVLRKLFDIKIAPIKIDISKFNYNGKMVRCNAIFCPACHSLMFSLYRHDYNECKCGAIFIDGGFDYCRHSSEGMLGSIGLPAKLLKEIGIYYPKEREYETNSGRRLSGKEDKSGIRVSAKKARTKC